MENSSTEPVQVVEYDDLKAQLADLPKGTLIHYNGDYHNISKFQKDCMKSHKWKFPVSEISFYHRDSSTKYDVKPSV